MHSLYAELIQVGLCVKISGKFMRRDSSDKFFHKEFSDKLLHKVFQINLCVEILQVSVKVEIIQLILCMGEVSAKFVFGFFCGFFFNFLNVQKLQSFSKFSHFFNIQKFYHFKNLLVF